MRAFATDRSYALYVSSITSTTRCSASLLKQVDKVSLATLNIHVVFVEENVTNFLHRGIWMRFHKRTRIWSNP
jgi:hypothetical protein